MTPSPGHGPFRSTIASESEAYLRWAGAGLGVGLAGTLLLELAASISRTASYSVPRPAEICLAAGAGLLLLSFAPFARVTRRAHIRAAVLVFCAVALAFVLTGPRACSGGACGGSIAQIRPAPIAAHRDVAHNGRSLRQAAENETRAIFLSGETAKLAQRTNETQAALQTDADAFKKLSDASAVQAELYAKSTSWMKAGADKTETVKGASTEPAEAALNEMGKILVSLQGLQASVVKSTAYADKTVRMIAAARETLTADGSAFDALDAKARKARGAIRRLAAEIGKSIEDKQLFVSGRRLVCVPYARTRSRITLHGDAYSWWEQAKAAYQVASTPQSDSVIVLSAKPAQGDGRLAAVTRVVSAREIRVDHASWSGDTTIYLNEPVIDVSPDNDWSQVRVWNSRAQQFSPATYALKGFLVAAAGSGGAHGEDVGTPKR